MAKNKDGNDAVEYKDEAPVIEDDLFMMGSQPSDFSKVIQEMFSDKNIQMKTDLSSKQIGKLTVLAQMAQTYDVPMLKAMIIRFIKLRVSKERKGRKETVSMTQQIAVMKRLEGIERQLGEVRK